MIGELKLYRENKEIGSYPLYAETSVDKAGIGLLFVRLIQSLF